MTTIDTVIPEDFPTGSHIGAVAGVQPKVLVTRDETGKYVAIQASERLERYDNCLDMVRQLVAYCRRKAEERPDLSMERVLKLTLESFERKVAYKGWDFTDLEVLWVGKRVAAQLREVA